MVSGSPGMLSKKAAPGVPKYELQWRRVGEDWPASNLVSDAKAIISVPNKDVKHEWRVQAEDGGAWAKATLPFSAQVLTMDAMAAIQETVVNIPPVTLTVVRMTTTPPAAPTSILSFSWDTVLDATAQYDFQWRVDQSGWQPLSPARVAGAVPPAIAEYIQSIGLAHLEVRHQGRGARGYRRSKRRLGSNRGTHTPCPHEFEGDQCRQ